MQSVSKYGKLALFALAAVAFAAEHLQAQVIYHDNYATWQWHWPIEGQPPNVVAQPGGTYTRTSTSQWEPDGIYANIGTHAGVGSPLGQFLEAKGPGGSNAKTSWTLPYNLNLTNNTDILRLTFTFRKGAPINNVGYNRVVFGYTGTDAVNDGYLDAYFRFDTGGVVRPYVPGTSTSLLGSSIYLDQNTTTAHQFNTVSIEYNPLKVATQPWSFKWNNNAKVDFPKAAQTSYTPLTKIEGIGFGILNAATDQDRTLWMKDFKFERIAQEVEPPQPGDLDGDGFVGQTDLNRILGSWGQNVPPGSASADADGSGSIGQGDLNMVLGNWGQGSQNVTAVPEPASLLLMGLAGVGMAAVKLRKRSRGETGN